MHTRDFFVLINSIVQSRVRPSVDVKRELTSSSQLTTTPNQAARAVFSQEIIQEKTRELVEAKIASTQTFHFALSRPLCMFTVRAEKIPSWHSK